MRASITACAAYVPRHRLQRADLGAVLGAPSGKGARIVASYDEDSTTMGFEAARLALGPGSAATSIHFATTSPAYFEKTNAAAIHAALDGGHEGFAVDLAGSARGATGALRAAAAARGLAVLADVRTGRPGSADERDGADGAAAFAFGEAGDGIADVVSEASATAEFLDRWRTPGASGGQQWEERFGVESYVPLITDAAARALAEAGVEQADHVVISSPHARAAATAGRKIAGRLDPAALPLGYAGAADAGLRLIAALEAAEPGQTILLLNAVDGCDATVLRTTDRIAAWQSPLALAVQLEGGRDVPYATYLTWRGHLDREGPRRPEPERPAAPPSQRSEAWKFAFVGTRCTRCSQVHLPPRRVCIGCGAVDQMERAPVADREAQVATYTVDRLAFSPSPPLIDAVLDFDGGGRFTLEVADAAPDEVAIGDRLELTFRRLYTVGGVHNYFWKARPLVTSPEVRT